MGWSDILRVLVDERGKKYLIGEKDFHSDFGFIKIKDIQVSKPGDILKSHLGRDFRVISPNVNDFIQLMERKCSIIFPKDMGAVVAYTGLGCGDKVIDAGTGAGASALFLGNIVGEAGRVFSYEVREDFVKIAKQNIADFGMKNVHVKCQDIGDGIDEKNVDLVFLDLPQPWDVVEHAAKALKLGGYMTSYTPYMEQVRKLHKVLNKFEFRELNTLECILRDMEVKNRGMRPKTRMVGHTGYLTIARYL